MISFFSIHNFRGGSYESLPIHTHEAIIGKNGSGKTHILEAIHLVSGGSLPYFQPPKDEISTFYLGYNEVGGIKNYGLTREETGDKYTIQGAKVTGKKYRSALPYRTVMVSPFDMNLLYFAPKERREYIDSIFERVFEQFRTVRREYDGIMRQRNALLKNIRDALAERKDLDFWDKQFSEKAYVYALYRKKWYNFLLEQIDIFSFFLGKYTLSCKYESRYFHEDDIEKSIYNYLIENRERDILTGHTHIGPHLDDFEFFVEDGGVKHSATTYLSRGEHKMLLLGLKQIEILFLRKYISLPIILLFDDLFAELDMNHAEKIIEQFDVDQLILTSQRELPKTEKWTHFSCINLSPE